MSRRKREGSPNPAVPFAPGLTIKAGGGGRIKAQTYDGLPPPALGPLPPRVPCIVSEVPTRPATAEGLAAMPRVDGPDPRD